MKSLLLGLALGLCAGALGAGLVLGRLAPAAPTHFTAARAADVQATDVQAPNDPRELIPLSPGPGQEPGQQPGQQNGPSPQPGQQPGQGKCPVLLLQDGKLYQLQPGQGNGQQGEGGQGGKPGGNDELFPLQPYEGPSPFSAPTPSWPFPSDPGVRA